MLSRVIFFNLVIAIFGVFRVLDFHRDFRVPYGEPVMPADTAIGRLMWESRSSRPAGRAAQPE